MYSLNHYQYFTLIRAVMNPIIYPLEVEGNKQMYKERFIAVTVIGVLRVLYFTWNYLVCHHDVMFNTVYKFKKAHQFVFQILIYYFFFLIEMFRRVIISFIT